MVGPPPSLFFFFFVPLHRHRPTSQQKETKITQKWAVKGQTKPSPSNSHWLFIIFITLYFILLLFVPVAIPIQNDRRGVIEGWWHHRKHFCTMTAEGKSCGEAATGCGGRHEEIQCEVEKASVEIAGKTRGNRVVWEKWGDIEHTIVYNGGLMVVQSGVVCVPNLSQPIKGKTIFSCTFDPS